MDNLVKYVKENKNKNFKDYPFNEIDAAIYSVLPYINFMGIINDSITIKEAYEKTKSRFLLKYQDKFLEKNKELFREMASSIRFKDNIITDYKKLVNHETQFAAIAKFLDILNILLLKELMMN